MRRLLVPLLVLAPVLSPSAARAAEVSWFSSGADQGVQVLAAPGETNDIQISSNGSLLEIRDAGAPLTVGQGCKQLDSSTAQCVGGNIVSVAAGDGDDRVTLSAPVFGRLNGGPGDDVLRGGPWRDRLLGGGGRDQLSGGDGDDVLLDGDPDAGPDADLIDGGPGIDVVSYGGRRKPVQVLLNGDGSSANAGQDGEGDRLEGIEGAHGGFGDDRLHAGSTGASPYIPYDKYEIEPGLKGGPGRDVVTGGPGPDLIEVGGGDLVDAGAGRDLVVFPDGPEALNGAIVRCGSGVDIVGGPGTQDLLSGCERVSVAYAQFVHDRAAIGGLRVRPLFRDRVRVELRVDGGRFDRRLIARRDFRDNTSRIRPTALGRRIARTGALRRIRVSVRTTEDLVFGFRLAAG